MANYLQAPKLRTGGKWYNPFDYEAGVTETLASVRSGGRTTELSSRLANPYTSYAQQQKQQYPNLEVQGPPGPPEGWQPPQPTPTPQVKGASTSAPANMNPAQQNDWARSQGFDGWSQYLDNINNPTTPFNGGPSEVDIINQEFNDFQNSLNQQEQLSRQNFAETEGLMSQQLEGARGRLQADHTRQVEGVQKQEALDLKRVRELLNELSQRDNARVAIYGGGSTAEALGARFAREAGSRLGNVMDQSRSAIENVNAFYNNKIADLESNYQATIANARQSLNANLAEISAQRQQSATEKQRGIMSAWRNYFDNVNNAKLQAAQFKAQYDMWKMQQDNQLAAAQNFDIQPQYQAGIEPSYNDPLGVSNQSQQAYSTNPLFRWLPNQQDDEELIGAGGGGGGGGAA